MGDERREILPEDRDERLYEKLTSFFNAPDGPSGVFTTLEVPQRNASMACAFDLTMQMLKRLSCIQEDRDGEARFFEELIGQFICGFESGYFLSQERALEPK